MAALLAALAAGCGSSSGGGGAGPAPEPAVATDEDLGSWVDTAALIVVTDRCTGAQSLQMDGPAGRLRLDEDEAAVASAAAGDCRIEERFEAEEDPS